MHTSSKPTPAERAAERAPDTESTPRRLSRLPAGRRTKWFVAVFWIAVMAVAVPLAGLVTDVEDNREACLSDSAESTHVEQLLPQFRTTDEIPAVVAYTRDAGLTTADRAAVQADRASLGRYVPEGRIQEAFASDDGQALLLVVPLEYDDESITDTVGALRAEVATSATNGLEVNVGGPAASLTDSVEVFSDLDANLLLFTAGVVAILLLLTYRSPVLWLIPLFTVGMASQVACAVVYLLGRYADMPVDGQSGGC